MNAVPAAVQTRRAVLVVMLVALAASWTIHLLNATTINYRLGSYTADTVNPGSPPPSSPALSGNVWFVVVPFVCITLLVISTLLRWVIPSSATWRTVHIVVAVVTILALVIVLIAISVVYIADGKWRTNANNMAADDRLCCIVPSINISQPKIPGCPVLFNDCDPSLQNAPMSFNPAFTTFYAMLFIDIVLVVITLAISIWTDVGPESQQGYETVATSMNGMRPVGVTVLGSGLGGMSNGRGLDLKSVVPVTNKAHKI